MQSGTRCGRTKTLPTPAPSPTNFRESDPIEASIVRSLQQCESPLPLSILAEHSISTRGMKMRLGAQMRGGFYPAPSQAIACAATFLRPPANAPFSVLDPCAGEGAAIQQLGDALCCPQSMTFTIELDEGRAQKV